MRTYSAPSSDVELTGSDAVQPLRSWSYSAGDMGLGPAAFAFAAGTLTSPGDLVVRRDGVPPSAAASPRDGNSVEPASRLVSPRNSARLKRLSFMCPSLPLPVA